MGQHKNRDKLNPKQEAFCREYLVDLNASQAARRAGYSEKTAAGIGQQNMRNPKITDAIQAKMDDRFTKLEITAEYVLSNLVELVERCMQRAPVMVRRGKEFVQLKDEEGRDVWKFDSAGATAALNLLGKHKKLFIDRIEHSGTVTLEALVADDPGPNKNKALEA